MDPPARPIKPSSTVFPEKIPSAIGNFFGHVGDRPSKLLDRKSCLPEAVAWNFPGKLLANFPRRREANFVVCECEKIAALARRKAAV
jgi:hypothetical protein